MEKVNVYFSNCFLEAKKAERKGCKVIKLGFLFTGGIIPHYFWYDAEKDMYFDFRKVKQSSNSFFYKGYIRGLSRKEFFKHVNRWVSNNVSKMEARMNIPVMQNNLENGTNLFVSDWWFEKERCISGKILYAEKADTGLVYKVENVDELNPSYDKTGFFVLKKLADNENVVGWMYWNVD